MKVGQYEHGLSVHVSDEALAAGIEAAVGRASDGQGFSDTGGRRLCCLTWDFASRADAEAAARAVKAIGHADVFVSSL